jgi:hypothetical protein
VRDWATDLRIWKAKKGACAVPVTWTVRDNTGQLLPHFVAGSRLEVGRKVVGNRYDAFRLQVSSSYREIFDRELSSVLKREDWQIVPLLRRRRTRRSSSIQFDLNLRGRLDPVPREWLQARKRRDWSKGIMIDASVSETKANFKDTTA